MASSSSKKTKRGRKDNSDDYPPIFDENRFCSFEHQKLYHSTLETHKIHSERVFELGDGEYPEISDEFDSRGWQNLLLLTGRFSTGIVREFYANARVQSRSSPTYQSYVRGRWISSSADMIGVVLDLPRTPACFYREKTNRYPDPAEIEETLCRPRGAWYRNVGVSPIRFDVAHLTPIARAWALFMHYSLLCCSNKTDLIAKRAYLVHVILKHDPIDICSVLAYDIHQLAQSGSWLGHPILIHKLYIHQGIEALDSMGKGVSPILKEHIDDFSDGPVVQPQPPLGVPDLGAEPNPILAQMLESQARMEALMISQHGTLRAEMALHRTENRNALMRMQTQLDRMERDLNIWTHPTTGDDD